MRRLWESMNKKWLAGPYLVWMVGFIVIPLLLIVYYGLTDKSGAFTLANVLSISTPEHVKALYLPGVIPGEYGHLPALSLSAGHDPA